MLNQGVNKLMGMSAKLDEESAINTKLKLRMSNQIIAAVVVVLSLFTITNAIAQCDSRISADTKLVNEQKGEITLKISTPHSFVFALESVSGAGVESISSGRGNGTTTKKIEVADISKLYRVKVEFEGVESKICRIKQTGILAFEAK
jgi:hypothetical protein